MLMNVLNEQKTESDYLSGILLQLVQRHELQLPVIQTLYNLMEVKVC